MTKIKKQKKEIVASPGRKEVSLSGFFQHPIRQAFLLFIFSFLLYANTLNHEYVFDDIVVIQNNSVVQKGFAGIGDLLTKDSFYGYFKGANDLSGGRYRPLSLVSFAIEKELFGGNPSVGHFMNVLFYSLAIVILFFTLRKILPPGIKEFALIAALLFAAHPIHTEVVANIKSRDEIFCLLFLLLTLLFYFRFLENSKLPQLVFSLLFYGLALLSKENAFTFLLIIPLAAFFFSGSGIKKILLSILPLFFMAVLFLFARSHFAGTIGDRESADIMSNPFLHASLADKYATITGVLGRYVLSAIYPFQMAYDYSYNQIPVTSWKNPLVLLAFVIIAGLIAFALVTFRKKNKFSFCILAFFITLSIVSNIFFPVGAPMADRFLFLPTIGSTLGLAFLGTYLPKGKNMLVPVLGIILLIYSARTFSRNQDWKSNFSLFEADVKNVPDNVRARVNFGSLLMSNAEQEKDPNKKTALLQEAFVHFSEAVRIHPGYADGYNHMGSYYSILGKPDSAILNFAKAVEYKPGFHSFENNLAHAWIEKGNSLFNAKLFQEAVLTYRNASGITPTNPEPYNNTAIAFLNMGRNDSAEYYFNTALSLDPAYENAKVNLANLYLRKGNEKLSGKENEEAIKWYELALKYNPSFSDAWSNEGNAYLNKNQLEQAIAHFRKAVEINPKNKVAIGNLVNCYTRAGDTQQAEAFRKMLVNN